MTIGIDIGNTNEGVGALQFTVFNVDFGGWVDRLAFRGSLDSLAETSIVTASSTNFVRGDEIVGRDGNDLFAGPDPEN